jgi:hypothetical protein
VIWSINHNNSPFSETKFNERLDSSDQQSLFAEMQIPKFCFWVCGSFASITFECGSELSQLPSLAFSESGLTSIHLPASVTVISEECFSRCDSLMSITIESDSQFSQLAKEAFSKSRLTSIHLPASVTVSGEFCFSSCCSLASIVLDSLKIGSDPIQIVKSRIVQIFFLPITISM